MTDKVVITIELTREQAYWYINFDWRRVLVAKIFYDAVKKALS